MPGTKRKASFRTPYERPSKIVKRSTGSNIGGLARARSISTKLTEVSTSSSVSTDDVSTVPSLRRASTLTLPEATSDATAFITAGGKMTSSLKKPSSLSRKSSSFVEEGALVTRLSRTSSGAIIGETSVVTTDDAGGATLDKVPSIPSGLTKLALPKSGTKDSSIRVSRSMLLGEVDENEVTSALESLRSSLSKEKSKTHSLEKAPSVRKSLSKKGSSLKSLTSEAVDGEKSSGDNAGDEFGGEAENEDMDTGAAPGAGLPPGGLMELVISFDTTGSMYGVLDSVRAQIQDLVQRLQADIPGIRISIIAHGDYCDEHSSYLIKWIDFGATLPEICEFVKGVARTGGGDGPECYELVLQRAREVLSWTTGSNRALILIGDDLPHESGYTYGGKTYNINWRDECDALRKMNVKVYPVQSGGNSSVKDVYTEMATRTGGKHLALSNLSSMFDFIMMVSYREANPDMMEIYEQEMRDRAGRMNADCDAMTKTLRAADCPTVSFAKPFAAASPFSFAEGASKISKRTTGSPKSRKAAKPVKKAPSKKLTKLYIKKAIKKPKTTTKIASAKKVKQPKVDSVSKREKLPDSCMTKGPLKRLSWSKWQKVVMPDPPLNKKEKDEFNKSRVLSGYGRKISRCFKDGFKPAVYEFAVQAPSKAAGKKYVVYCLHRRGPARGGTVNSTFLRTKSLKKAANRVLEAGCSIFVRRGTYKKSVKKSLDSIDKYISGNFDYAWKKYIWRRTPEGNQRHRNIHITRKGKVIVLSETDC
ncbi:uncharacterized protein LOC127880582 [Dreissena polymorpha]|uniref:VWFA domain-containing protein n=1 Tax=Dreissena polymorpha TaxID=45954 RepID=A0A9D4GNK6_DREPO|nr:uncharacterized protein LOC127880582 [Dreissena polymorpha]KAH3817172.1 hypothetical protein DPMN_118702 [Dreissena polymorpha]